MFRSLFLSLLVVGIVVLHYGSKRYAEYTIIQNESFLMSVKHVYPVRGKGVVIVGEIEKGMIATGDSIDIAGVIPGVTKARTKVIEKAGVPVPSARKGDEVHLLLGGVERAVIRKGMVAAAPNSMVIAYEFQAEIKLTSLDTRNDAAVDGFAPQIIVRDFITSASFILDDRSILRINENAKVGIRVSDPVVVESNLEFSIIQMGKTIGTGKVIDY